jgi:hypothetical protein
MVTTTNQPTNQPTNERTNRVRRLGESANQRPSVCLGVPALTTSLGSITDTLNYKWNCAYANGFLVAVERPRRGQNEGHCSGGRRPYEGS